MPNEGVRPQLSIEIDTALLRKLKFSIEKLLAVIKDEVFFKEGGGFFASKVLRPWHQEKSGGNIQKGNQRYLQKEKVEFICMAFASLLHKDEAKKDIEQKLSRYIYSEAEVKPLAKFLNAAKNFFIGLNEHGNQFFALLESTTLDVLGVTEEERFSMVECDMLYANDFVLVNPYVFKGGADVILDEMYKIRNALLIDANTDLSDPEIDEIDEESEEIIKFVKNQLRQFI